MQSKQKHKLCPLASILHPRTTKPNVAIAALERENRQPIVLPLEGETSHGKNDRSHGEY